MAESRTPESASISKEDESCRMVIVPKVPSHVEVSTVSSFILEKITRGHEDLWKRVTKLENSMVFVHKRRASVYFVVLQLSEFAIKATLQTVSDTHGVRTNGVCECANIFSIFEDVLHLANIQFLTFRACGGDAFVSVKQETKSIPVRIFYRLETMVTEISSHRTQLSELMARTFTGNLDSSGISSVNGLMKDRTLLPKLSELGIQQQEAVRELNKFIEKLLTNFGNITIQIENINSANSFTFDEERAGEVDEVYSEQDSSTIDNKPESRDVPLPMLLDGLSQRLLVADWDNLRQYFSRFFEISALPVTTDDNGFELFDVLINKNLIGRGNLEFLRNAFYEIGRVDLVHLIDCVQEGDYTFLTEQPQEGQRNGSEYTEARNRFPIPPTTPMENLTVRDNEAPTAQNRCIGRSPESTMEGNMGDMRDNNVLQRRYRDEPQEVRSFSSYPIQENVANSSNEAGVGTVRVEATCDSEEATPGSDYERVQQTGGSGDASSAASWVNSPDFPCDHYDRYCDVQFKCCEEFWPCHRCHNSDSSCSSKKLRSRDITMIRCRRCFRIQQFPKNSPNCVECNLKFAEYFCPICQHLTGTQNHPFHCEKCGICRVHGDRSFHCDVCGVCLDVNLRGKHKCRAGSAHDQCCICFEDAFSGCQILPCSHKVHKDCATLMLRNGITRCPVCRESFERRVQSRQ